MVLWKYWNEILNSHNLGNQSYLDFYFALKLFFKTLRNFVLLAESSLQQGSDSADSGFWHTYSTRENIVQAKEY